MISMNFNIPEENLYKLDKIVGRVNKRAKKLKLPVVDLVVGTPVLKSVRVENETGLGEYVLTMMFPVTLTGQNPILAGWKFLGKLDHLPGTNDNIVLGDEVPKKFQNCPPNCDHCNKERNRAETFVLKNIATSEVQQVGTSCLKDFFNGDDPMQHAGFLQFLVRIQDELSDLEEPGLGNTKSHYRDAVEILTVASTYVRTNGFLSAGAAEVSGATSTGQLVREALTVKGCYPKNVSDDDRAKALEVLKWLKSDEFLSSKADNDYTHNLATLAAAGVAKTKYIGILASAVVAYDRAQERARLRANEAPSNFVGTLNERLNHTEVTIAAKIHIPGAQFGDKTLYIMRDRDENRLAWFCTGYEIAGIGDKIHITGTVSDHSQYKGQNQTTLKRVVALENKLIDAVQDRKDVKSISKLLQESVNLDHRYFGTKVDGMTALMIACRNGDRTLTELLLERGANPDVKDSSGLTAAHYAATRAHIDCLETLNEWGADFTLVARRMETVPALLEVAQSHISKSLALPKCIPERQDLKEIPPEQMYERGDVKIAELGTKESLLEYIQGARALAEANGQYFHVPNADIILEETNGKLTIVSGHLQVAEAVELKSPHINAYIVSDLPKPIVSLIMEQAEVDSDLDVESEPKKRCGPRP